MNEMEAKGVSSSGVTVVGSDDPTSYHISPRAENDAARLTGEAAAPADAQPPVTVSKKKRGRPRKHGPDGPATAKPISVSSPPAVIDFSAQKRPKLKPTSALIKQHQSKFEPQNSGEWASSTVGTNFTPHVINVNRGEDVTMKVISFAQQGPRAICILSANGIISSVALCQPDSFGGTLTYEGCFEILSLTGSFMPSESGGIKNRSGGMSVSLSSPDGRVFGGGVAGLLVAATSVQIVVGSFLAGNQLDQKPKKQKSEFITSKSSTANVGVPVSSSAEFVKNDYGSHGFQTSGGTITYSFQEETRNGLDDNENTLHEDC